MAPDGSSGLPDGRITVPAHVVERAFSGDTVVLNLRTGQYHGLNEVAAAMLAELRRHGTVDGAAAAVAATVDAPDEVVRADLLALCEQLLERGLIEVGP